MEDKLVEGNGLRRGEGEFLGCGFGHRRRLLGSRFRADRRLPLSALSLHPSPSNLFLFDLGAEPQPMNRDSKATLSNLR